MSIASMDRYANPQHVSVGQTWIAKNPIKTAPHADRLIIKSAFTKHHIFVELTNGITLQTDESYLLSAYTLDSASDLFEADNG